MYDDVIKIIIKIIECYHAYGVLLYVTGHFVIRKFESFIIKCKLCLGTKIEDVYKVTESVKIALGINRLKPFVKDNTLYIFFSFCNKVCNDLNSMLTCDAPFNKNYFLPIALGYDLWDKMFYVDLAQAVHLLYVGATQTGKSMALKCLILSLILFHEVSEVNLIIIDLGSSSLRIFEGIPHLSFRMVEDYATANYVLDKIVEEINRRIKLSSDELKNSSAIVVIIDELNSVLNFKAISEKISDCLDRGRKAKIHTVLATQNLDKKASDLHLNNIRNRIVFKTNNYHESVAVIGEAGAEKIPEEKGAMLYKSDTLEKSVIIQGAYISDKDIEKIVNDVKNHDYNLDNKFEISEIDISEMKMNEIMNSHENDTAVNEDNTELAKITMDVLSQKEVSVNKFKEKYHCGTEVMNRYFDKLQSWGIISEKYKNKPRNVIPACIDDIQPAAMTILNKYGYTSEVIAKIISKRIKSE